MDCGNISYLSELLLLLLQYSLVLFLSWIIRYCYNPFYIASKGHETNPISFQIKIQAIDLHPVSLNAGQPNKVSGQIQNFGYNNNTLYCTHYEHQLACLTSVRSFESKFLHCLLESVSSSALLGPLTLLSHSYFKHTTHPHMSQSQHMELNLNSSFKV